FEEIRNKTAPSANDSDSALLAVANGARCPCRPFHVWLSALVAYRRGSEGLGRRGDNSARTCLWGSCYREGQESLGCGDISWSSCLIRTTGHRNVEGGANGPRGARP